MNSCHKEGVRDWNR
eukprot:gene27233-biopygen17764